MNSYSSSNVVYVACSLKMIVKNLHVLSFAFLFKDIIKKDSLDYDFLRLKEFQLRDLSSRASAIISDLIKLLEEKVKIIGHNTLDIFWESTSTDLCIEIPDEYKSLSYTHEFFPVALYRDSRKYVLSDGTSLKTKGTILPRRDIANVCKLMFKQRVNELLELSSDSVDLSALTIDDFLFKSKLAPLKVLDDRGRKVLYNEQQLSNLSIDVYRSFVNKYVQQLLD